MQTLPYALSRRGLTVNLAAATGVISLRRAWLYVPVLVTRTLSCNAKSLLLQLRPL
jgi:hypothetical protein